MMRYGNMFKSDVDDPEINVFHNTVLIIQSQRAIFNLFRSYERNSVRRAYNNIFVGIDNGGADGSAAGYLPRLTDQAEQTATATSGSTEHSPTLLRVRDLDGEPPLKFGSINELHASSQYFADSVLAHPPGFEAHGTARTPACGGTGCRGSPHRRLRLAPGSPAQGGGVQLHRRPPRNRRQPARRSTASTSAATPTGRRRSPSASTDAASSRPCESARTRPTRPRSSRETSPAQDHRIVPCWSF